MGRDTYVFANGCPEASGGLRELACHMTCGRTKSNYYGGPGIPIVCSIGNDRGNDIVSCRAHRKAHITCTSTVKLHDHSEAQCDTPELQHYRLVAASVTLHTS